MKKHVICIFIVAVFLNLCGCFVHKENESNNSLYWIKEDGRFIDYSIYGETIAFRYLVSFKNNSDHDLIITAPTVYFQKKDMQGWIDYHDSLESSFPNDEHNVLIKSGEKKDIILEFEGPYSGGVVNENISPPDKIIFIQKIA